MGFFENVIASKQDFVVETGATLYMVVVTSIIAAAVGGVLAGAGVRLPEVVLEPFSRLSRPIQRVVEEEAARLEAFLAD